MTARCLMVQGTASGVGKSLLTAAFCRVFARAGLRVAPFKAQNMALNAAVTADGREIGRAQAVQAEAAGVEPTADMNPILLKPEADDRSQVVVLGRALGAMRFREYRARRAEWAAVIADSLARLRAAHDLVLIEGAGSPAEINLAADDLSNMAVARLAGAPVVLVGDIDRGGVFAAFVGTLALLPPEDRARVGGLIVNRFRGDRTILEPGLAEVAARTGVPVLGVVPWLGRGLVAAEDSLDLEAWTPASEARLDVAVVRLPHLANFDDVEPLAAEPGVRVRLVTRPAELVGADLVVLPGSKSTIADLSWLGARGLDRAVRLAAGLGTPVLGLCGGYQMLGREVRDPDGVESSVPAAPGLGLLPVVTTFARVKATARVRVRVSADTGFFGAAAGAEVAGYEIHMGRSAAADARPPFVILERNGRAVDEPDGALSGDGLVAGTYVHGLLGDSRLRRAVLTWLARRRGVAVDPRWGGGRSAAARYDLLADLVAAAVDVKALARLVGL
jgi:adenosylcobyric acid synthase